MSIHFADSSNSAIDHLVSLCTQTATASRSGILLTRPLDEFDRPTDITENDAPEAPDEAPAITSRIQAYPFTASQRYIQDLTIAVDSGVITLGQVAGGGIAFAVRGAAVCMAQKELLILRYNTGALLLTPTNMLPVFRYIGERLGTPDLYVKEEKGRFLPQASAIDTVNQATDRCRNFVERMIQEEAIGILSANHGGLLLIDGALTVSFDTPKLYLSEMLRYAQLHGVDICAISKRSNITIGTVPVSAIFDQFPTFVGYAPLLQVIEQERGAYMQGTVRAGRDVTAGTELYAARFAFGPPGVTFRVDVSKSMGSTDVDVINDVYNTCHIYGGYPRPLIDAHHYSAFLAGDGITLLSDLVVHTGLHVREQPSLEVLFQPFGAFGK